MTVKAATGPNREAQINEARADIRAIIAKGRPAAAVQEAMRRELSCMSGRVRYTEHDAQDGGPEDWS